MKRILLSERDLRLARIAILRELTGHEAARSEPAGVPAAPPRASAFDVLTLALAAR